MAVRKKLVRSNLFAFPGTAPGFSQGHIAAASIYNWSAVALGAAMVGVIGGTAGQVGTIGAGPLAAKIDSIIGPATVFTTAQSINPPALTQLVAYQGTTFAAIVNLTNVASGAFFSNTTSAANGINMGPNTGALQLLVNGSFACTGSGVTVSVNVPCFVAGSYLDNTRCNFLVRRLDTGTTQTGTSTSPVLAQTTPTGGFRINRTAGGNSMAGAIAAVMMSAKYMTIPQLMAWADNPWAFWYPQ